MNLRVVDAFEPARIVLRDPRTTYAELGPAIEVLAESNDPRDIRTVSMFRNLGWSDAACDRDIAQARASLDDHGYHAPARKDGRIEDAKPRPTAIDYARYVIWALLAVVGLALLMVLVLLIGAWMQRFNLALDETVARAIAMRGM